MCIKNTFFQCKTDKHVLCSLKQVRVKYNKRPGGQKMEDEHGYHNVKDTPSPAGTFATQVLICMTGREITTANIAK